jgi:hypothetical protein
MSIISEGTKSEDEGDHLNVKEVRWAEQIEESCQVLLSRERTHSSMTVAIERGSPLQRCSCLEGCFVNSARKPRRINVLQSGGKQQRRTQNGDPSVQKIKVRRTDFISGHLWKMNQDATDAVESTPNCVADLSHWRRRLFILRNNPEDNDEAALVYLSEKNGGDMNLACRVNGAMKIEKLPDVDIGALSDEMRLKYQRAAYLYDVALTASRKAEDEYNEVVPRRLFPWSLQWVDTSGTTRWIEVAASTDSIRDTWLDMLNSVQAKHS